MQLHSIKMKIGYIKFAYYLKLFQLIGNKCLNPAHLTQQQIALFQNNMCIPFF